MIISFQTIKWSHEAALPVVMIVWWLDLQLPLQSVPISTKVVSSNPTMFTQYNIM